jgi:hypothetical protein
MLSQSYSEPLPSHAPVIKDRAELQLRLQEAIALEHFTIPPYLFALYSLIDGKMGPNKEAYQILLSVAMEEMLHMIMVANILTAISGKPRIVAKELLPRYPSPMPHSANAFQVNLLKFSKEAVTTFLKIERPAQSTAPKKAGKFRSIGEFYAAVREAINRLDLEEKKNGQPRGIFTGNEQHQVTEEHYYGGGGKLVSVYSIDDANRALEEIVGQGEGIDGTIEDADETMFGEEIELAHYFRFNEIFCERRYRYTDQPSDAPSGEPLPVDWNAVYNVMPNPKMKDFKKTPGIFQKAKTFNQTYSKLLRNIETACTGNPQVLRDGIPLMHALRNQAIELMNDKSGDFTAGPSFEYVP